MNMLQALNEAYGLVRAGEYADAMELVQDVIVELDKGEFEPTTATEAYLQQKLIESLAREAVWADRCRYFESATAGAPHDRINEVAPEPSSDNLTTLQAHDAEVRKAALLEASDTFEILGGASTEQLRRMVY